MTYMKATDLMIGDWVLINNSPHKIQAIDSIDAEILADDELYYVGEDRCHSEDKIEGIPITPEILDKNGFYDRNTQWYYKRFGPYVLFDIAISLVYREIEVSKVCGAGTDCEEEEYGSSIVFGNDIYVHTLQHALRLCGLDELADNFKV